MSLRSTRLGLALALIILCGMIGLLLAGADTGLRSIFIAASGHHSRVIPGLQLAPDRDAPPIEIDLQPTDPGEEPHIESAGINAVVSAVGDLPRMRRSTSRSRAVGSSTDSSPGAQILRVPGRLRRRCTLDLRGCAVGWAFALARRLL